MQLDRLVVMSVSMVVAAATADARPGTEVAAAKRLLDAQITAIAESDPRAFAATFDTGAYLILPTTAEASGRPKIEEAVGAWLADAGDVDARIERSKVGGMGDRGCAWISAVIAVKGAESMHYRVTELVAPIQQDTPDSLGVADYRILVAHISEPVADSTLFAKALDDEMPELPEIEGGTAALDATDSPGSLARLPVANDPAATLIGSAPKELYMGKSAVASTLKAWRKLRMHEVTMLHLGDVVRTSVYAGVWHVNLTLHIAGRDVVIPFRALTITYGPPPSVREPTYLAVAHFSVAIR